jgi:RNA polymerase sigma-54 factor
MEKSISEAFFLCYTENMPGYGLGQIQQASQVQRQILSQRQIQALGLLAMNSQDLSAEIYKAVDANPALEIVRDPNITETGSRTHTGGSADNTRIGTSSAAGEEKAQQFQEAYENAADTRETLSEHLLFQLNVMKLSPDEKSLGEALIHNLDENGFHILAPVSLLDKSRPAQNEGMLAKMMNIVQRMDPEGTCCRNMEESLFVQAQMQEHVPPLALFILDGNISVLYSNDSAPDMERIRRKIVKIQEERKKLSFGAPTPIDSLDITAEDVKRAVAFISRLNPHPAQGYGRASSQYVRPDVKITKETGEMPKADESHEALVSAGDGSYYRITLENDTLPEVRIVPGLESQDYKGLKKNLTAAQAFLENLAFRRTIILRASSYIVSCQTNFFMSEGRSYLEPMTEKRVAREAGVHESTISRMANDKYMQAPWGQLFPIKYFFTNSQNRVKFTIKKLLENRMPGEKPLSDREIAEQLARMNITVARRTVAKYRKALNISSSYERKN